MSLNLRGRAIAAFGVAVAIGCSPEPREPAQPALTPRRENGVQAGESPKPPIAPKLGTEELESALLCFAGPHVGCWREDAVHGLLRCADRAVHLPGGARFEFAAHDGLWTELAQLVSRERRCCSALAFSLHAAPERGPIALEVSGGPIQRKLPGAR